MPNSLPKYALRLDALHETLKEDFSQIVAKVPLVNQQLVVDAGCGDGFFTSLLAAKAEHVIGFDTCEAYLDEARTTTLGTNIEYRSGDARHLPFENGSVDVVWSGHCMQSYPDLRECLAEFWRVLKPNGVLAVLETDSIHSVMLSWPPDIELALRQAEHQEIGDEDSYIGTYFPRFAGDLFAESGFDEFTPHYYFAHRHGPADETLSEFVRLYLDNLLSSTNDCLGADMQAKVALLANPTSDRFLPRTEHFFFGSLQVLMLGQK